MNVSFAEEREVDMTFFDKKAVGLALAVLCLVVAFGILCTVRVRRRGERSVDGEPLALSNAMASVVPAPKLENVQAPPAFTSPEAVVVPGHQSVVLSQEFADWMVSRVKAVGYNPTPFFFLAGWLSVRRASFLGERTGAFLLRPGDELALGVASLDQLPGYPRGFEGDVLSLEALLAYLRREAPPSGSVDSWVRAMAVYVYGDDQESVESLLVGLRRAGALDVAELVLGSE